jgi:hypothetical protein
MEIDGRPVQAAAFRAAWQRAFKDQLGEPKTRVAAARGARGRKRASDRRRPLRGCFHEFSYHEDTIGDGFYTATERWLECDHCGEKRAATYKDIPSYDDYY